MTNLQKEYNETLKDLLQAVHKATWDPKATIEDFEDADSAIRSHNRVRLALGYKTILTYKDIDVRNSAAFVRFETF